MFDNPDVRLEPDSHDVQMPWAERLVRWIAAISVTVLVLGLLNYGVRMLE